MKPVECVHEAEVLAAVFQSRWPEQVSEELRTHAANCGICSDVAAVAGAIGECHEALMAEAAVPDSSQVWRRAQLRARREDVRTAGRPITAAQVLAFACAMGLLGALFGATSTWFQAALKRTSTIAGGFDMATALASASKLLMENGPFVLSLVAAVFLVPMAFYLALGRD